MACHAEPCGCDEANQLREIPEGLVEYNDGTSPCGDEDECGCGFCMGRILLRHLQKRRDELFAQGGQTVKFININFTLGDVQPKQGELKWDK